MTDPETLLLSIAYADPSAIDKAIAAGVTAECFPSWTCRTQWQILHELRATGQGTDTIAVYSAATTTGRLTAVGDLAGITACSQAEGFGFANVESAAAVLVAGHSRREAWRMVTRAKEMLEADSVDLAEVGKISEGLASLCAGRRETTVTVADIAREAESEAAAAISGTKDNRVQILTGFANFDRWATPMYPHEIVTVGGRSSHGKSSLMLQIASNNLARGLKVAIFTLETSAKSVVKQMAAQRAKINLRSINDADKATQEKYMNGLKYLGDSKNLLIFDKDLTSEQIQSRCRLIAGTFAPNLVVIDYIGLVGIAGKTLYERASAASKLMIPTQKSLGCVLMMGCQLNQESEKDKREPGRTDFRDSGTVLDDSHRIIQVWRKPDQHLDQQFFDCELLQVKNRDGPLGKQAVRFHAPTASFSE